MNATLIVGSKSGILNDYVMQLKVQKTAIIEIDRFKNTMSNPNYLMVNFQDKSSFNLIHKFILKKNLKINKIVFAEGINPSNSFFATSQSDWDSTFEVNTKSVLFTLKSVYDFLAPVTSIVVIASTNGIVGHEERVEYGPSKAALIQLVKNLTVDFSKDTEKDIRINAVSPTYVQTTNNATFLKTYKGKQLLNKIPYHKFITPDDVKNSIEFLLSSKSNSIRGINLILDNGYTII